MSKKNKFYVLFFYGKIDWLRCCIGVGTYFFTEPYSLKNKFDMKDWAGMDFMEWMAWKSDEQ